MNEVMDRQADRVAAGTDPQPEPVASRAGRLSKLANGSFVPSELVVWAAGVKGPEVLRRLDGLETNRINQLVVKPTPRTTRDHDIFAIRDCAACACSGTSTLVPPRGQAAHQEATHMVGQIWRRLHGIPLQTYTYRNFGTLVSLSKCSTVGNPMGFLSGHGIFIEGMFARMRYRSLRLMHEKALGGTWRAVPASISRASAHRIATPVKLH